MVKAKTPPPPPLEYFETKGNKAGKGKAKGKHEGKGKGEAKGKGEGKGKRGSSSDGTMGQAIGKAKVGKGNAKGKHEGKGKGEAKGKGEGWYYGTGHWKSQGWQGKGHAVEEVGKEKPERKRG